MKKTLFVLLIIGLALLLGACNTNTGGPAGGDEGEDTEWDVDFLYVVGNSETYPGAEVDLSDRNLVDISVYASVTVNATLYTDEGGTNKATTPSGDNKNLAQFTLLKSEGGWGEENRCGPPKYNMNIDGDTSWTVPATASGVPIKILIQANWEDFTTDGVKVKSIRVNKITFTAKTSDVVLDVVYGDSYVSTAGNKITFTNAMYSDGAAIYEFKNFPATLTGKTLVINFSIQDHTPHVTVDGNKDNAEHQIHIQAANSDKNGFNGQNPPDHNNVGQKYITLDSTNETGWNDSTHTGTIRVPLNDLLAAAEVSADANDCKGPFDLDAIRIVNNGTKWTDAGVAHIRCRSYTLVIESVTVQ